MADWANLPAHLLYSIYRYLPRRDLMSCNFVCMNWSDSLDYLRLWQNYVVYIDVDLLGLLFPPPARQYKHAQLFNTAFSEPSTTLLLRQFCKYVRTFEIGWAISQSRCPRWSPLRYKELTKRTTRLLTILHDGGTQLVRFRIFNWFDVIPCKKIMYHIRRLLQGQHKLKSIALDNTNLYTDNYIRMLSCCINCKDTITHLDVRNCHYSAGALDTLYFQNFVQQLNNLNTFKLDYHTLSCGLMKSIVRCGSRLEHLEILIKGNVFYKAIQESDWEMLNSAYPSLKVAIFIKSGHYKMIKQYLDEVIPVASISTSLSQIPPNCDKNRLINEIDDCSSEYDEDFDDEYTIRKTFDYFIANYYETLESIDLHVNNFVKETQRYEVIDDLLMLLLRRCPKLSRLTFKGYLHDPERFATAYKRKQCVEEANQNTVNECEHVQILIDSNRYAMTYI